MIDYQEVKEATVHPSLHFAGPSEYIASMIAPCYAVTLPATYSPRQSNVTWGQIIEEKKTNFFFFFSAL